MLNKKILVGTGMAIGGIILGAFLLLRSKSSGPLVSPSTFTAPSKTEEKLEFTVWKDPLGFSFSYPKEVKLDPHEEDQENYAHIDLTSELYKGGITVWVKDTEYSQLEDFVKEDPIATDASALDGRLSGIFAKKLYFSHPEKKLMVATIYDELLFLLEMKPDSDGYWEKAYDKLLSSFSFGSVAGKEEEEGQVFEGEAVGEGEESSETTEEEEVVE